MPPVLFQVFQWHWARLWQFYGNFLLNSTHRRFRDGRSLANRPWGYLSGGWWWDGTPLYYVSGGLLDSPTERSLMSGYAFQ